MEKNKTPKWKNATDYIIREDKCSVIVKPRSETWSPISCVRANSQAKVLVKDIEDGFLNNYAIWGSKESWGFMSAEIIEQFTELGNGVIRILINSYGDVLNDTLMEVIYDVPDYKDMWDHYWIYVRSGKMFDSDGNSTKSSLPSLPGYKRGNSKEEEDEARDKPTKKKRKLTDGN